MGITRNGRICALVAVLFAVAHCGIAQQCNSYLNGQLLVSEEGKLSRVNPTNPSVRETLATKVNPSSLQYSFTRNTIYYSDLESGQILALKDKSNKAKVVITNEKRWLPSGLVIDDVSEKMYVADAFAGTVGIFDLRANNNAIVLGSNLTNPSRLAIDTQEGYLFVLDKYQILRTDLDGSNPVVLYREFGSLNDILENLPPHLRALARSFVEEDPASQKFRLAISVADILVDTSSRRLYWVNTFTRKIESIHYDGSDRRVHFHEETGPAESDSLFTSLALLDGNLYWSDEHLNRVFKVNVNNANDDFEVILDGVKLQSIKAVSCSNYQQGRNPCSGNNGQCQHLCVLSKTNFEGFKCHCNVGYELAQDGKSCNPVQDFLLFVQDGYMKGRGLNTEGELSADVINPTKFEVGSGTHLAFDANEGQIFFTSLFPSDQVHQVSLATSEQKKLLPDFLSKNAFYLAYDWVSHNLYYVTYYYADVNTLSVVNVRDPSYSKILVKHVPRLVRGIAVHPNAGYVYFARSETDGQESRSIISRMNTDGSDLKVIVDAPNIDSIDGLTIDFAENRLYWSESKRNGGPRRYYRKVRHSNLDGTDIQEIALPNHVQGINFLSVDKTHIYLVYDEQTLARLNKRTGDVDIITNGESPGSMTDVKVYSRDLQTTKPGHPCAVHDCEKFCFAVPSQNGELKGVCGCPYGQKLDVDGKSCVDNSRNEPPFVPCKYTSFKCNMKTETVA